MKLEIKNLKIELPEEARDCSKAQFLEWFRYQFGINLRVNKDNPLLNIDLGDCNYSGEVYLDNEPVKVRRRIEN
jgi:hypothetical protein